MSAWLADQSGSQSACHAALFFNFFTPDAEPDLDGIVLDSFETTLEEAVRSAGEAIRELAPAYKPGQEMRLEVTDEMNTALAVVHILAEDLRKRG
jgi:hypothetical protein